MVDVDPKLAQFYRGLLACGSAHHQVYIDMLQEIYPKEVIFERLEYLAVQEQAIVDEPGKLPRMHS